MQVLIIADAPGLVEIPQGKYGKVIALDGAAMKLQSAGIIPDAIIGDMDTLTQPAADYFNAQGVTILKIDSQDSTDMDKGIDYADGLGASNITIINALGGRMDHTLYNVRILRRHYRPKRPIILANGHELARYFCDCRIEVRGKAGDAIALMAMPEATVTSTGLKYDMESYRLHFGFQESACNSMAGKYARIDLVGEALLIYVDSAKTTLRA